MENSRQDGEIMIIYCHVISGQESFFIYNAVQENYIIFIDLFTNTITPKHLSYEKFISHELKIWFPKMYIFLIKLFAKQ